MPRYIAVLPNVTETPSSIQSDPAAKTRQLFDQWGGALCVAGLLGAAGIAHDISKSAPFDEALLTAQIQLIRDLNPHGYTECVAVDDTHRTTVTFNHAVIGPLSLIKKSYRNVTLGDMPTYQAAFCDDPVANGQRLVSYDHSIALVAADIDQLKTSPNALQLRNSGEQGYVELHSPAR